MRALILGALVAAAILLAGCPRPIPPPTPDGTVANTLPACSPTAPTAADVCDGLFTTEGLACVRCPGVSGCLDRDDRVYCVNGACLSDPRCRLELQDAADAGTASAARRPR